MAKPQQTRAETKTVAPQQAETLALTQPLFGVTKGLEAGKWVAVRVHNGVTEALTPKRGGKDAGEQLHHATARVVDSFKAAVLRGKLAS